MPGLVLFKRRWSVGSDDFVYPNLIEIILRLTWLIVIAVVFYVNGDRFTCEDANLLKIYYIGLITILIASIGIATIIMFTSMKGTIADTSKRTSIPLLLYIKLIVLLPECIWVLLGTYWAFGKEYHCPNVLVEVVKGTVICSWIVGLIVLIVIFLVFDPMGKHHQQVRLKKRSSEGVQDYQSIAAIKAWERRCKVMCCCIANNQQNQDAFTEISKLVADFFLDIDLVPTDIAAGLLLVQKQQNLESNQLSSTRMNCNEDNDLLQPPMPKPKQWMTIKLMTHYMNFAAASYGWPLFMYTNLGTGCCQLLRKSRCCSCIRQEYNIVKDNTCNCHTAAILIQTGLKKEDLIYVSYHNKLAEIPFYVAVDRKEMKIVVSIRGTMSLEDALVDLTAVGVKINIPGLDNVCLHSGIYECAKYIQSQLQLLQLIEKASTALPEATGLVITGHSLGAGAAAILAILLKPTYPNLICYSFSPPGGLLSRNASVHTQDYICSVVVGKDVIPRLCIPSINKLKGQILNVLAECKKPKYKIFAGGCLCFCCECLINDPKRRKSCENKRSNNPHENLEDSWRIAYDNSNSIINTVEWPIHPPGQILHIYENEDERACCGEPIYNAKWSHPDDFSEILISPNMVFDHISDVVLDALTQLTIRNIEATATPILDRGLSFSVTIHDIELQSTQI